jgi:WD40 repeat protein
MFLNEATAEGFVTTHSGTIWFVDWAMETTLKINSFHSNTSSLCKFGFKYVSPNEFEISEKKGIEIDYEFDKNYYVMSSSDDGILKLWNLHTSEQMMQFVVPKEKCTSLAIHQFKPYIVAGFTDGYIRFFEIDKKNSSLGRCQISEGDYIMDIKILPTGNHILAASSLGLIIIIFIERWEPLAIRIETIT